MTYDQDDFQVALILAGVIVLVNWILLFVVGDVERLGPRWRWWFAASFLPNPFVSSILLGSVLENGMDRFIPVCVWLIVSLSWTLCSVVAGYSQELGPTSHGRFRQRVWYALAVLTSPVTALILLRMSPERKTSTQGNIWE